MKKRRPRGGASSSVRRRASAPRPTARERWATRSHGRIGRRWHARPPVCRPPRAPGQRASMTAPGAPRRSARRRRWDRARTPRPGATSGPPHPWGHGLVRKQHGNAGEGPDSSRRTSEKSAPPIAVTAPDAPGAGTAGGTGTSPIQRSSSWAIRSLRVGACRYRLPLATPTRRATSSIVSARQPCSNSNSPTAWRIACSRHSRTRSLNRERASSPAVSCDADDTVSPLDSAPPSTIARARSTLQRISRKQNP